MKTNTKTIIGLTVAISFTLQATLLADAPARAGVGEQQRLIGVMKDAINESAEDATTRLRLGAYLTSLGRQAEGDRWIQEALRIDPSLQVTHMDPHTHGHDHPPVVDPITGERSWACGGNPGPDIIVGVLPNTSYYGSVGGIHAYAIGTTSCNAGTQNANWVSSNNDHPVIAQNMYRLKDGRFEQIGMSWLKHGFLALTQNECGCGCNGQGGSTLGVGCSDPYSSSLNGQQSNLGPRWQVNATTGVFQYPWSGGAPSPQGTIGRRLQVQEQYLTPSLNQGARYFIEGQYIAKDDAAAGNGYNNASYREVNVNASFTLSLVGPTIQAVPAIFAWQAIDPEVMMTVIDVPGDGGRFFLGARAYDNGDGTWTYEYALHNLDVHRSAGSFSVPVSSGVDITGVGFHDVPYHSGDGNNWQTYSNADWGTSVSNGALRWETDSFSTNENANALRWGTLYNFRFTADSPPVEDDVTIGLFRPGTPDTIVAKTLVPESAVACVGDLNGDGVVDGRDLAILLTSWGDCPAPCAADLADDGVVDGRDLAVLLTNWGNCSAR